MTNFKYAKKYTIFNRSIGLCGQELIVYLNTETNKGFEDYLGQILDASGNVTATVLGGTPNIIMNKLKRISKILNGGEQ